MHMCHFVRRCTCMRCIGYAHAYVHPIMCCTRMCCQCARAADCERLLANYFHNAICHLRHIHWRYRTMGNKFDRSYCFEKSIVSHMPMQALARNEVEELHARVHVSMAFCMDVGNRAQLHAKSWMRIVRCMCFVRHAYTICTRVRMWPRMGNYYYTTCVCIVYLVIVGQCCCPLL